MLRALALRQDDRYANAGELADDIENYLHGEPLKALPHTLRYVLRKWGRKRWLKLSVAAAAFVAAVTAGVLYVHDIRAEQARTDFARRQAVRNALQASVQRGIALEALDGMVRRPSDCSPEAGRRCGSAPG